MADELDVLLGKVESAALREELRIAVDRVRAKRSFGLVFESHLPERVRLHDHPVRRGVNVVRRDEGDDGFQGTVDNVSRGQATVNAADGSATSVPVAELVVTAEFGEPIYPGLTQLGSVDRGGDKPAHIVINAENHHALEMLQFTHAGKIDCIYIDPPYNLGGDLIYNDRRVARDDAFRHSKWLSFMDRRLKLAKSLMHEQSVLIVAIDDTEQAHLRLLLDQIFGEPNFIACVVWHGGRKNDARFVSVGHDYMLIYARSKQDLIDAGVEWDVPRPGQEEMLAAGRACWERSGGDPANATALMKEWIKALPPGHPAKANNRFYEFDSGTGRQFRKDNVSWPGAGGPRYDVLHPVTGLPVRVPGRGWRYSTPERMQEMILAGQILFGADHTEYINRKLYLDEADSMVPESVFQQKRTSASTALRALLGDERFKFPKDTSVLSRWISIASDHKQNAVVLDFFAGSGSTCHAVMELNRSDGGSRSCILVTNNEVSEAAAKRLAVEGLKDGDPGWEAEGLFESVTRPRVEIAAVGLREDGSVHSSGFDENVRFMKLTYQDPVDVELDQAFAAIAPLLWMRAGGQGEMIQRLADVDDVPVAFDCTDRYAVLFDADRWREFVAALPATVVIVFVVTDSPSVFAGVAEALPSGVEPVRLYENYLSTFAINRGEST
ncbi:MAG: site-specific DNA-methyltransferase [Actinomycetia bacterium]|nr:site-specific DNA-methyltransferase [Actinomycetes bacterium]